MKKLILIILLFIEQPGHAQNWQTFSSNRDAFFKCASTGSNVPYFVYGLIRAYHADSASFDGIDSTLYLFKSVRTTTGLCLDYLGDSWMGNRVIIRPNGDNIFYNLDNQGITIRTQASINDVFDLIRFANGERIAAVVTGLSAGTVLNTPDSIKTFTLHAVDSAGNTIPHLINGRTFSISKNHGMVSHFVWAAFPSDTTLYSITDATRLTVGEIYDYEVGDVFQFHSGCHQPPNPGGYTEYEITGKWYSPGNDTVFYDRFVSVKNFIFIPNPPHLDSTMSTYTDVVSYTGLSDFFYDGAYPEESIADTTLLYGGLTWYYMDANPFAYNGRTQIFYSIPSYYWNGSCFEQNQLNEYHIDGFNVVAGCGIWQYLFYDNINLPAYNCFSDLIYFRKGTETWGTPYLINSTAELQAPVPPVLLYPNPADDKVNVFLDKPALVSLVNILGECIWQIPASAGQSELDVSGLSPGMYWIRTRDSSVRWIKR